MFRRRRPLKNEAIHFSFDSFLDLVTNVVGIIIRLILVTWVRCAYHTSMQWVGDQPQTPVKKLDAPRVVDDPVTQASKTHAANSTRPRNGCLLI